MRIHVENRLEVVKAPERLTEFASSPEQWAAIRCAKEQAGELWPEVCWSALPCLEAGAPMRQALDTGLYEWDLTPDPLARRAR